MTSKNILALLPYEKPFLFVEDLTVISEEGITGNYTFKETEYFYKGHFKDHPVTPGVILTECMAQIGVVCLGIYLMKDEISEILQPQIAMTSSQVDFFLPVFPREKVRVVSEKEVFRFNKLKCKLKMFNEKNELVCRGVISGMLRIPAPASSTDRKAGNL
ncbi:3-hydroxyacyl-ACP dehydratase FabZ family protein [Gelidibacter mesophilus]|uniref:3-hydroxyacyl-ACP dehydratase FabZ family protein n=1 Tax=Gelidibacter mesophilus TaxID=169050 RepID=UPI000410BD5A|nr:hydroxymyristoyl-ACP dehydratase [Gelidibacter mesophilus]